MTAIRYDVRKGRYRMNFCNDDDDDDERWHDDYHLIVKCQLYLSDAERRLESLKKPNNSCDENNNIVA